MLFKAPSLNSDERETIHQINEIRKSLQYALFNPKRWFGLLRRTTLARAVRGSNSIEGYNASVEDAIAAAEGEEPLHDGKTETWHAIKGYQQAMTFVLQLAADPHFRLNEGYIRSLHYMILHYDISKHPGCWRPGPIFVRDEAQRETVYEGPDADMVPELFREFVTELNYEMGDRSPMVRAAMAHLNLVMIHPFSDGNGRMGRVLHTLILAREGILDPHFCSIEEYLGRNTPEYYGALAKTGKGSWQPGNDTTEWVRFCLKAHFYQATTLLRRTRETEKVWSELEVLVTKLHLPERAIYALSDAAFGWKVRNASYRTVADVSDQTASRDLKQLVDQGLLIAGGEKRGRFYVASEHLRQIRERLRETRQVVQPKGPMQYVLRLEP
ncbi:MAG: Fic family protein [Acidobacteria bacterium]|nr:Fic family protein [Acidobacteriota bacterium]